MTIVLFHSHVHTGGVWNCVALMNLTFCSHSKFRYEFCEFGANSLRSFIAHITKIITSVYWGVSSGSVCFCSWVFILKPTFPYINTAMPYVAIRLLAWCISFRDFSLKLSFLQADVSCESTLLRFCHCFVCFVILRGHSCVLTGPVSATYSTDSYWFS